MQDRDRDEGEGVSAVLVAFLPEGSDKGREGRGLQYRDEGSLHQSEDPGEKEGEICDLGQPGQAESERLPGGLGKMEAAPCI